MRSSAGRLGTRASILLSALGALFAEGAVGPVSHSGKHRNQRRLAVGLVGQGTGRAAQRRQRQREAMAGLPQGLGSQAVLREQRRALDPKREEEHRASMEELRAAHMKRLLAERDGVAP